MWICSTIGFYSIVRKGSPAGTWQVRARVRKDLENLCTASDLPQDRITSQPGTDYAYRLKGITQAELGSVFGALAEGITYDNFKSEVGRHPDQQEHLHKYHQIWNLLSQLQPSAPYSSHGTNEPSTNVTKRRVRARSIVEEMGADGWFNDTAD